jgi:hypothetical protein
MACHMGEFVMVRCPQAAIAAAAWVALWLIAGDGIAAAQSLPAEGRYECAGSAAAVAMSFTVGPGNIYTTTKGYRGTMSIHPGTGNLLFHGAPPHNAYQARYSSGPPPQVTFVTAAGSESGVTCQVH